MTISPSVVGVVSFYMVAALIMVFVNKMVMLNNPELTILFMFFQSLTTVLLLTLTSFLTPLVSVPSWSRSSVPANIATIKNLFPLILIDALGFVFNALCLRDVEAAFYQIARGMVLPLTITVVALTSRTPPAKSVVICAFVVTVGFLLGVAWPTADVPTTSMPGPLALTYGVLSSLSIAIHAVLIKSSLTYVGGSPTQLSYWANFGATIFLSVLALLRGETQAFMRMVAEGTVDLRTFFWGNVITGVFGFLISVAGILSVKVTSPVTHMFSSAARSVLQVALGVKIFGDVVNQQRVLSVLTILAGTLMYTWVKSREPPSHGARDGTGEADRRAKEIEDLEMEKRALQLEAQEEEEEAQQKA
ncbi:hypothetical protein C8J56DRAFT_1003296 [Mycena floridula]|nr:hypothetical protein C8J56DRAFT_1003296 [Mycena floridula]